MLCLTHPTSERWVDIALANLDAVLVDHAHCEMKAATNALSLAVRASETPGVVAELVTLAEEELVHFRRVLSELELRGVALGPPPPDGYAVELRKTVRAHRDLGHPLRASQQIDALIDRLLVAALIEARSCERFSLLAQACEDRELAKLYQGLWASEHGHYRTFIQLAEQIRPPKVVAKRWEEMLDAEAEIIRGQAPGARMHSGARPP